MIFNLVKPLVEFFHSRNVQTTSFVFRLITRYTVNLFILFVIFLSANHLFGNPIECYGGNSPVSKITELNCWLEGLYIDKNFLEGERGREIISYGVGIRDSEKPDLVYFKFYQWIVPLIMLQTLILYIPRGIWRMQENGTMMCLLDKIYCPVLNDEWNKRKNNLVAYIKDVRKKYHRHYALNYLLCEFMTIAVILINMFILKYVVVDFWNEYQPAVAAFFSGNFSDFNRQAARLFPTQAKCKFYYGGPSGSIQEKDALCVLPQNIVNEKIFVIIYVWYIFLLIMAIFNVLCFLAMYIFKILRIFNIGHMLERTVTIRECKEISSNGDVGLWFTLSVYRKNLAAIHFQDLCRELHDKLKHEKASTHLEYEDMDKYS